MSELKGKKISIHFHPFGDIKKSEHIIEKVDKGVKRKYLRGISSGIKKDGHGERMTPNCIKSMMEQGNSGNVLLYAGMHGVDFTDDIGILTNSEIYKNTDWLTEYRLYDELDNIEDQATLGKAKKLWKQVNGIAPYKRKIQKGFSIEGVVPETAIIDKDVDEYGNYTNRVIDDIVLDGVVVVNRPAYQDSVVNAVYKCLGELPPAGIEKIKKAYQGSLSQALSDEEQRRNFYHKFFEINSALEEKISDIMKNEDGRNQHRLKILFDEYKSIMIGLILQHADIFQEEPAEISADVQSPIIEVGKANKLLKSLAGTTRQLSTILLKRIGGTDVSKTKK